MEEKDFDFEESLEARLNESFGDGAIFDEGKVAEKLKNASKNLPQWSLEPPFEV